MKPQQPLDGDWDYLIILDACRYDTFSEIFGEYLSGTLEKRRSIGSSTPEWAAKTFTGQHDITYFSSNPFINGLGIPINEMQWGSSCDYDWAADDHIHTVIDLWYSAWDEDLDTVTPDAVNEAVRTHQAEIDATERTIIHYMQPHAPYITQGTGRKEGQIRKSLKEAKEEGATGGVLTPLLDPVLPRLERFLEDSELAMKAGLLLELDASSLLEVGRQGSREVLEEYYEANLRLVLEHVRELVQELDGTVVVTSDHGEAFGEDGVWEHHVETHIPVLVEVPWLEVDGVVDE
ncbi:MAG: hypothetical protein SVW77_00330 [Candidatus Nanohaloarchaea archaeon]|nr:hypothetical protein [Candidatus Nanohaloarchaea archaeon]